MTDIKRAKKESKALTAKQGDLKSMIQSGDFKVQIRNALPQGGLTTERYISACLTALAVTPKLQQCTSSSVLKAFMESARFGLEPNSPLAEAHLIPYGDKVEFQIAYRGMMKLAWNTGVIKSLDFDKVCENDQFVYTKGREINFEHTPNLMSDRGKPYAYYAVAELKNGGFALHIMSKKDIVNHGQHYSRSFSQKSSPWQTDFDAMAFKTVIKQLCDKKLPKATTEQSMILHEAARLDDIPDELEVFPEIDQASSEIASNNNQPEPEPEPEPEQSNVNVSTQTEFNYPEEEFQEAGEIVG